VWTGSFNFTYTGTRSFENAIYIEDPEVSRAYFNEWEQIAALSEPLDWESPYVAPQWRIGS
jgi:phosphatidylserine/phosphatidylglycerophosphate/cardiolipin synthase-like enzyme